MSEPEHLSDLRAVYDAVAVSYEELLRDALAEMPLDRAMLGAFAEQVRASGVEGPVADLGCGPGRVTAYLRDLGLDAFGVDLSSQMVAVARQRHPGLRFETGTMTALDLPDGSCAGVVSWYSTVHTPPEVLPEIFAEFHRVLAPGGHLVLAGKAGDQRLRRDQAYGHDVSFDVYWVPPEHVSALLTEAGLSVHACMVREPTRRERPTQGPQTYLLAHRPED